MDDYSRKEATRALDEAARALRVVVDARGHWSVRFAEQVVRVLFRLVIGDNRALLERLASQARFSWALADKLPDDEAASRLRAAELGEPGEAALQRAWQAFGDSKLDSSRAISEAIEKQFQPKAYAIFIVGGPGDADDAIVSLRDESVSTYDRMVESLRPTADRIASMAARRRSS